MNFFIKILSDNLNELVPVSIGNKAFSLARLYQENFPVPKTAIVTTEAFNYFLNISDIVSHLTVNKEYLKIHLEEMKKEIVLSEIPSDLSSAIYTAYLSLNSKFVAVRSSATIEDGEGYSFAGQFESFLGVARDDLLMKIKLCWASLFSSRVSAYSKEEKYSGNIAVIIQEMIDADVSGVCFSMDPVSHNHNSIIIEAVLGLGEPLVQGAFVPDHYVIDKETLIIQKKNVTINAQKEKLSLDVSNGGTKKYCVNTSNIQKVDNETLKKIATITLKVEKLYDRPVDIEWALKDNKFYLLQARPITTLFKNKSVLSNP